MTIVGNEPTIPAGMKRWGGGDSAPADWEGLAPCPFCGNEAQIESQPSYSQAANTCERFRAWCDHCCFGLEWHSYERYAIAAWNKRAAILPEVERLEIPAGIADQLCEVLQLIDRLSRAEHGEHSASQAARLLPIGQAARAALTLVKSGDEPATRASSACPICGDDKPHHHTQPVVDAYQHKGNRK